jgi:hypothetical protein
MALAATLGLRALTAAHPERPSPAALRLGVADYARPAGCWRRPSTPVGIRLVQLGWRMRPRTSSAVSISIEHHASLRAEA